MKIFLSAVSSQFKACRDALRSDLSAVGADVKVQEDFQQHSGSLLQKLERYIVSCDRIIALVGDVYGFEPAEAARPAGKPRRSYTQWEYFFALGERLDAARQPGKDAPRQPAKEIFLYFATPEFLAMHAVAQPSDVSQLQQDFINGLKLSGKDWNQFGLLHELRALVLRDGFQLQERAAQPSNLPYTSLGSLFLGHDDVLLNLRERFKQDPARALAIQGPAGVGKTRLTIEYALRNEADYTALLIADADSPESLQRNLAAFCGAQVLNLPERDAKEQDVQVAAALGWLSQHSGWLLILDNADTREAAETVEALLPKLKTGHVLITSRLTDWSSSVAPFEVELLGEPAAIEFLLERTKNRRVAGASDRERARDLAKELDGLPLALEQAGAFISQMRCSFDDYLSRRDAREEKVRAWHDARLMHYPLSVAVTWDITFQQLDGAARALLNLLCWLAPEPVPRAVIAGMKLQRQKNSASETPAEDLDLEDAIAELAAFSMLKWEAGNLAFRMHSLVIDVIREGISPENRPAILQGMLQLVSNYIPGDPPPNDVRSWPLWETMVPHVTELILQAIEFRIGHPTSRLASMLGMFFSERGLLSEAESLQGLALTIDEQILGPEHPTVAIRLNNLAQTFEESGRTAEAEPLLLRALAIEETSFGKNHANVAVRLHNLAALFVRTGRLEEAEPLIQRALTIDEENLGPEHPDTARDLNLLAGVLIYTKRHAEAEPLQRRALVIDERVFGPEHPHIARDLNNLAHVLWENNGLDEAKALLDRALSINEKNYGDEHPHVHLIRKELAQLLHDIESRRKRRATKPKTDSRRKKPPRR